jgi:hypothetical protein
LNLERLLKRGTCVDKKDRDQKSSDDTSIRLMTTLSSLHISHTRSRTLATKAVASKDTESLVTITIEAEESLSSRLSTKGNPTNDPTAREESATF